MTPFFIEKPLSDLIVRHPDSETIRKLIAESNNRSKEVFIRLWLTEGEPFAFRNCPGIFEELRDWLGHRLEIDPKQVTLLGSARIGFSLAPDPRFGRAFSENSDLDLAIVSNKSFEKVKNECISFEKNYAENEITPRNDREKLIWDENIKFFKRNLSKGFMDVNKIPFRDEYIFSKKIGNLMWQIKEKLSVTSYAPSPPKVSLRVYRSWDDLVKRVSVNLKSIY